MKKSVVLVLVSLILSFTVLIVAHADSYTPPLNSYPNQGGFLGFGGTNSSFPGKIHVGIDFQSTVTTPVYAVLDGTVVISQDARGYGDPNNYETTGGVIVIRHKDNQGRYFYAVYGHIYRTKAVGSFVSRGEQIGTIRPYGTWPHLHFGINTAEASMAGYATSAGNWVNPVSYLNTFCKDSATSQPPSLNNPSNGDPFPNNKSITFSWSSNGASMYHVQITNPSGSNTDITVTNQTYCTFKPNVTGTWRWKVIAHNDSGDTGSWSESRSFIVKDDSTPSAPTESYSVSYYNNVTCSGSVASSESGLSSINRDWGTTGSPGGCTPNLFSAVFTGNISFQSGWYRFNYTVDDSVKLWLSKGSFSDCVCDNNGQKTSPQSGGRYYNITSAGTYTVRVEYIKCHAGTGKVQVSWTPVATPVFTVSFNSQGGSSVSAQTLICDSKITQPTNPVRDGYTFGGWYTDSGCSNQWNFSSNTIGGNITLYAKWTINSYTVRFDSQGGSTVSSITANYNSKISSPSNPTRSGYSFGGWYEEEECWNQWSFSSDTVMGNITLYAKWNSTAKPDLAPISITYSESVAIGSVIHFKSGVQNKGGADSGSFNVSWKVDSVQKSHGSHTGVKANSTVTDGQFDWTPNASGTYIISFTVDCDSNVPESNENNNTTSVTVIVPILATKPDLAPTTITYDHSVAIGKQTYFDSGIVNSGGTATEFFNIKWEVNGERLGYGGHYSVPANSTVMDGNSQFYWTPSAAGSYTIKFTVDCDSQVSESNENNNSTSVTVVIPQSTVTRVNWGSAYRNYLKKYFKARYYEYVGLIDIGRDGTPEMVYIEQNSSRRNPRMRIVGMVGSKAKIVSTRDYGRLLEGYSLYIRRNSSEYGCYVYGTYYSKDRKYMYENTVRITQSSSTRYGYTVVYGYRQRLSNGSEVYTVNGRSATGDEYSEVGEAFEDGWALCEPGLARIGRHTKLSYILNYFDQEAAAYTMPS